MVLVDSNGSVGLFPFGLFGLFPFGLLFDWSIGLFGSSGEYGLLVIGLIG